MTSNLAEALDQLREGSPGSISRSATTLRALAAAGDPEASLRMSTLAAAGVGVRQGWDEAFDCLERAAVLGSTEAGAQLCILADETIAPQPPEGSSWGTLRQRIRLSDWIAPPVKRVLHQSPRLVAISGFVPVPVCNWAIARSKGRLGRAAVYGAAGTGPLQSKARSNSAFELSFLDCDLVLILLRHRIAATLGVPLQALEPPQILHYATGQAFVRHFDYLDPGGVEVATRGQRMITFLIYLNAAFEGGETEFPHLGLAHRGGVGDALYFGNLQMSGAPDPLTLHAGLAPTGGEKWVFSQWIRNRAVV